MAKAAEIAMEAGEAVDLARYPIRDPDSAEAAAFLAECRRRFSESGLCMLPDFLTKDALARLAAEANGASGRAYYCRSSHNPYLTADDASLPADDPRRRREETFVGSVAYDLIPQDALLRRLYGWDPLTDFIAGVLGKPELHRLGDPLGACSINVFRDGGRHGWHFDESEFTVTLMLQAPASGGAFEYLPGIRGRPDEHAIVGRALDGAGDEVVQLPFTPGTLLIFGGRNTLHRVTEVSGDRLRLVPVLCYSAVPDLQNSDEVRQLFWGRTGREMTGQN